MKRWPMFLLLCSCLVLVACYTRPEAPAVPASGSGANDGGQGVQYLANWTIYVSILAIIVSVVIAWLGNIKLASRVAGIGATGLGVGSVLQWVGAWWDWIKAGLVAVCFAVSGMWAWRNRAYAEHIVGEIDGIPGIGMPGHKQETQKGVKIKKGTTNGH